MDFRGTTGNLSDDDAAATHVRDLFKDIILPADLWENTITYSEGDWVYYSGSWFRYINATPSSGNATSNTTYWQEYDQVGYEEHLRAKIGSYLIVSDDGYVQEWVCSLKTDYLFHPLHTFEQIDDPQPGTDNELHLEAGDFIFFSSFTEHGTDTGYYNLYFRIMNGQYGDAIGGINGRKGIVLISSAADRNALSDDQTVAKVLNEKALKDIMKNFVREIEITSLPTGNLKYYNTSIGNVSGMATNDIALIGSGVTKTIYRYNGSGWDSGLGTITFANSSFRTLDWLIQYDNGSVHFRAPDTIGAAGEFVCVLSSDILLDGDLFFSEQVAVV